MSRPETIHTELVVLQCRYHLVVGESLKPWTHLERVFLILAERVVGTGFVSVCGKGGYGLGGRETPRNPFGQCGCLRCLCAKVDEFQQVLIMGYVCRILAVFLPFKHGIDIKLQLQCGGDEWTRRLIIHSLRALRCCCTVSCRRRNSFPLPSLREGASRIMRTCVW